MTYYGGKELAAAFRTVRQNTLQIAQEIPENQYGYRAAPDTMSVGEIVAHIALGHGFQTYVHGKRLTDFSTLNFPELMQKATQEEKKPRSKAELIALLESEGNKVEAFLANLPEATLAESVTMPLGSQPAAKSRFEMLLSIKEHEMHHRGQLMLIQRLLGIVPHLTRSRQQRMAAAQQPAQR